jgi:hypothetical protein
MVTSMDTAATTVMDIVTNTALAMDSVMGMHMPLKPAVTGLQWLNIHIFNIPTSVHCLSVSVPQSFTVNMPESLTESVTVHPGAPVSSLTD